MPARGRWTLRVSRTRPKPDSTATAGNVLCNSIRLRTLQEYLSALDWALVSELGKIRVGGLRGWDPFSMRLKTIRKGDKLRTYIVSDLLLVHKRVFSENRISRQV